MKKLHMMAAALAGATLLTGCLSAPFVPPAGAISSIRAPLSTEGNWKIGAKKGVAASSCVLGIYASGDCSISAAAAQGGLHTVYHADYDYTNILGIWQEAKVIVYGE